MASVKPASLQIGESSPNYVDDAGQGKGGHFCFGHPCKVLAWLGDSFSLPALLVMANATRFL